MGKLNPILAEIRRVRDEIARRNGHDLDRIVADLKASEAKRNAAKAPAPAKKRELTPRRRKAA